jgi:predicted HicB family RNase H-like nuclease
MTNRTTIQIELEDELLFQLMLRAHDQDITLNQLIEQILREYILNNPLANEEPA